MTGTDVPVVLRSSTGAQPVVVFREWAGSIVPAPADPRQRFGLTVDNEEFSGGTFETLGSLGAFVPLLLGEPGV
ncbi:MAG: hypothetical protein WCF36_08770 [Candidatus Nanopelagicales bacterium]